MARRELASSIVLIALACGTLWLASDLPLGSLSSPQTGFFPLILGALLLILSIILLGESLTREKRQALPSWTTVGGWRTLLLTGGILFAVAVLFELIGYIAAVAIIMLFLLRTIGKRKWPVVLLISGASALGFFLVFGYLLKIPLPQGIWMR